MHNSSIIFGNAHMNTIRGYTVSRVYPCGHHSGFYAVRRDSAAGAPPPLCLEHINPLAQCTTVLQSLVAVKGNDLALVQNHNARDM